MNENIDRDLNELCFIYQLRIVLYKERDLWRHKYNYLLDIKRAMKKGEKVTKTYRDMSISQVRILILEAQGKLCDVKARIMRHTNRHDKRVKKLIESTGFSPVYRYGKISSLQKLWHTSGLTIGSIIKPDGIKDRHDRHIVEREVEKMLSE